MLIGVFCGSRTGNDPIYAAKASELGRFMASHDHSLIYGGEDCGLMRVLADTMAEGGGHIIGVIPNLTFAKESRYQKLSECLEVDTMADRKAVMISKADAFIALPGGPGTMDEYSEVLSLNKIHEIDKPVVLYDIAGFYKPVGAYFDGMVRAEFIHPEDISRLLISDDLSTIEAFLEK